ncbi:MAG: hypothetical protein ABW352_02870 [Polyangiales bacterium]
MQECADHLGRISDLFVRMLGEAQVARADAALRFTFRDVSHTLVVFDQGSGPLALVAVALPRPISRESCRGLFEDLHAEWRIGILEESDRSYLAASAPASTVTLVAAVRCVEVLARALGRLAAAPGRVSQSGTRLVEGVQPSCATRAQLTGRNQRMMK